MSVKKIDTSKSTYISKILANYLKTSIYCWAW